MAATRTAVVAVAQWPLWAALEQQHDHARSNQHQRAQPGPDPHQHAQPDLDPHRDPIIVVEHHQVREANLGARAVGITPGMRQRTARSLCPHGVMLTAQRDAESALFELVAAAVDTVAVGVDVLAPGTLLFAAAAPARHHGSEETLAERIIDAVGENTGWECHVGIADGPFAATLAARSGRIITPGRSADYLAPYPIRTLMQAPVGQGWSRTPGFASTAASTARTRATAAELEAVVDLLERLGIRTLADFTALPRAAVADRFGAQVADLHLLACGEDITPPAMHHPAPPLLVEHALEHPIERTDQAAFVARPLAQKLHQMLVEHGLSCTRLCISARTADGTEHERIWRHDGALSVSDIVDRIRWQCDGWITRSAIGGPQIAPIVHLALEPVQVVPVFEHAPTLWGSNGQEAERAQRAFTRAQSIAGEHAVTVPVATGGRLLTTQMSLIPWGHEKPTPNAGPWPGAVHGPVPATAFRSRPAVRIHDAHANAVVVTERGLLSATPAYFSFADDTPPAAVRDLFSTATPLAITGYGAAVLIDEQWWQPAGQRSARMQLVVRSEAADDCEEIALLALCRQGAWELEGIYD